MPKPPAPPAKPANPEKELVDLAQQSDDLEAEAGAAAVLSGDYSPELVGKFFEALNRVLALFGEKPVKGEEIGPEAVKALRMVASAAEDAGLEAPDLAAQDDADLELVIGVLESLATDPSFKRFLRSRAPERKAAPPKPKAEPKAPKGGEDMDAMFAGRMGV
jgi:hypothetical protein